MKKIDINISSSCKKINNYLKPYSFINVFFNVIVYSILLSFIAAIICILPSSTPDAEEFMKTYWPIVVFQLAALGYVYNIRRHLSEDYYKEAKDQLSKAYENLSHYKDGMLDNDRLRWLTTARMISVSNMLSKKIMMSSHKIINREDRQFWRIKFSNIVEDFPAKFYAEKPEHLMMHAGHERSPIAEASLVEIYDFMKWPDDYVDPLYDKRFSNEEIERMTIRGPRGLGYLLKAHRELKKKS